MALVRALANDLADRIERQRDKKLVRGSDQPQLEVTHRSLGVESIAEGLGIAQDTGGRDDVFEQPAGSKIRLEPINRGISLTVPPLGIWKGSSGMMFMALFWLTITGVVTAAMVASGDAPWFTFLFISVFWVIGIGLIYGAIRMGSRRAIIDVVYETLLVSESAIGSGTKQHEWAADELRSIHMGSSGMKVNNKPVMQLQIQPTQGDKLGLFTGRDREELRWLATTLRQALSLNGEPSLDTSVHEDMSSSNHAEDQPRRRFFQRCRESWNLTRSTHHVLMSCSDS